MLIGITGASGAGKSTVSKELNKILPNSVIIYGDLYMMDLAQSLEDKIFKKLGKVKEYGVFSSNYFFESKESMNIFINVIKKELIKSINNDIKNYKDKDYIIIDWVFLPLCDLFNKCDITICVKANYNIRLERLNNRIKNEIVHKRDWNLFDKYKKGTLERRVKFTNLKNYKYTYQISNNKHEDELNPKINNIVNKIKRLVTL